MNYQDLFSALSTLKNRPTPVKQPNPSDPDQMAAGLQDLFKSHAIHFAPSLSANPEPPQAPSSADLAKKSGMERVNRAVQIVANLNAYKKRFQDRNGQDTGDQCPHPGHGKHPRYTDCGRFMHAVFNADDPSFPESGTGNIGPHIRSATTPVFGAWGHQVYPGYQTGRIDPKVLLPGDLLYKAPPSSHATGHVALYGGPNPNSDPKKPNYIIYEASFGDHAPKKHTINSLSQFQIFARPNPKRE